MSHLPGYPDWPDTNTTRIRFAWYEARTALDGWYPILITQALTPWLARIWLRREVARVRRDWDRR